MVGPGVPFHRWHLDSVALELRAQIAHVLLDRLFAPIIGEQLPKPLLRHLLCLREEQPDEHGAACGRQFDRFSTGRADARDTENIDAHSRSIRFHEPTVAQDPGDGPENQLNG